MNTLRTAAVALAATATATVGCMTSALPAHAATLPATKVTAANLPTVKQVPYLSGATTTWTYPGDGQGVQNICQTTGLGSYHPNAQFSRDINARNTQVGASVASFPTHARAVQVADAFNKSLRCTANAQAQGALKNSASTSTRTVTLAGGVTVHLNYLTYATKGAEYTSETDVAVFAVGTHVEMLSAQYGTQENIQSYLLKSVQNTLPTLAR